MNKKIDFVQGLRGIACLAVVLYHGSYWTGEWKEATEKVFFAAGYFGVSLFFVISGFIMVITTKKSDGSLSYVKSFITKRFMRIWPAYFIATIISFLLLDGVSWFASTEHLTYFLRSMMFIPAGTAPAPTFGTPVLPVGWTLTYEMIFYVLFAISMLAGKLRWVVFYTIAMFMLIVLPFILKGGFSFAPTFDYGLNSISLGLITSPIIWMFVAGVVIGQFYSSKIKIRSETLCWMMVFFSCSLVVSQYVAGARIGHGLFEWGLSLIPLMLCLTIASKTIDIKIPRAVIYLGDISFSLYLMHVLMQGVTLHAIIDTGFGDFVHGITNIITTTTTSIIAAGLFHKYVETFFSNNLLKFFNKKTDIVTASAKDILPAGEIRPHQ